jgi:hypothetical protein
MTVEERPHVGFAAINSLRRLANVRMLLVLLTAALAFAALVHVEGLGQTPALTGFAAVAIAVLIRELNLSRGTHNAPHADRLMPAIVDRPDP